MDEPAKLQKARLPCTETPALLMITKNFEIMTMIPGMKQGGSRV